MCGIFGFALTKPRYLAPKENMQFLFPSLAKRMYSAAYTILWKKIIDELKSV